MGIPINSSFVTLDSYGEVKNTKLHAILDKKRRFSLSVYDTLPSNVLSVWLLGSVTKQRINAIGN